MCVCVRVFPILKVKFLEWFLIILVIIMIVSIYMKHTDCCRGFRYHKPTSTRESEVHYIITGYYTVIAV